MKSCSLWEPEFGRQVGIWSHLNLLPGYSISCGVGLIQFPRSFFVTVNRSTQESWTRILSLSIDILPSTSAPVCNSYNALLCRYRLRAAASLRSPAITPWEMYRMERPKLRLTG